MFTSFAANTVNPIPTTISHCGESMTVNICSNLACQTSNSSCIDDGTFTAFQTSPVSFTCGTETIVEDSAVSCRCTTSEAVRLEVSVVDADTGTPLGGVDVSIAVLRESEVTDSNGQVTLNVLRGIYSVILSVTVTGSLYVDNSREVDLSVTRSVTVHLFKRSEPVTINSAMSNSLSLSENPSDASSPLQIDIPANSFFDTNGNMVEGNVNVFLNVIPPSIDISDRAPGVFRAVDENGELTELQTGGVFTISAEDMSGNRVSATGLPVRAENGFRLFVLHPDGTWKIVPRPPVRRRRQGSPTSTYEFLGEVGISTTGARWYNIDKFPENTRCWFKTQLYDSSTGNRITGISQNVYYRGLAVAHTNEPSIFPRYLYTNNADDMCFEFRCNNPNTNREPVGYIFMEAIYALPLFLAKRANPYDITQYPVSVQTKFNSLNFSRLATDPDKPSIKIDLAAMTDGPFFATKADCQSAGNVATDNVFKFELTSIKQSSLDSNTRCVARVLHETQYGLRISNFYGISSWNETDFYLFAGNATSAGDNSSYVLCMEYRCSEMDSLTNVSVSIGPSGRELYGCGPIDFSPDIISMTGAGYFYNTDGNAGAALSECKADMSINYAHDVTCMQGETASTNSTNITTSSPQN